MRNLRWFFLVGLATGFIGEKLFVSSQTLVSTTDDMYLEGLTSGDLPIDDEDGDDGGSGSGSGAFAFTDKEEILRRLTNFSQTTVSKETVPTQPMPKADPPHNPSTTAATKGKDTETTPFMLPNGDSRDEEVAGTTADWFSQSSTSRPTSETIATKFGIEITVINDPVEDNSLDRWDVSTPNNREDNVLIAEVENEIKATNGRSRIYEMDSPAEVTSENMWERTEVLAAVIACGVVGFLCAVFLLLLIAYRMKKKDEGSYNLGDTKDSTTAYHKAPTKEFYA
ncbi:syndecan-2-like isoform X1 [Etheostoma cragini]|uniref:syndecan-2-like isoform X1 n=1 Tax=Etheostoma cragini TaxID=417921 RepID=UPI00155DE429|nr:syndecan-2-like isoform X1 [Etheostoma cragini]